MRRGLLPASHRQGQVVFTGFGSLSVPQSPRTTNQPCTGLGGRAPYLGTIPFSKQFKSISSFKLLTFNIFLHIAACKRRVVMYNQFFVNSISLSPKSTRLNLQVSRFQLFSDRDISGVKFDVLRSTDDTTNFKLCKSDWFRNLKFSHFEAIFHCPSNYQVIHLNFDNCVEIICALVNVGS